MQDRKLGLVGGIVRAAQLHPWRTVEHCTIVLLALHLLSGRACHSRGGALLCPAGQQPCCCAADTPGPRAVLSAEGVTPAPQPTMAMADLRPGETVEHHDFRGDIYRFPLGDGIILNLMRTTAGTMRSGDLHNCTQFDVILAGRAKLVTYDTVTRRETAVVYGRNDFIKIPARVPHLFEFLEDNYMVEWWDCDFRAWYYQPYRDRISRAFEAAKAKDAASKAAAAAAGGAGERAGRGQAAGDSASQSEDQQGAASAGEQSRAEAARLQRDGAQAAQHVQQQRPARQAGVDGAASQSAGGGASKQAVGTGQGAQEAAGVSAAGGQGQHERTNSGSEDDVVADPRLEDPVAGASAKRDASGSDAGAAADAQSGVSSSAADGDTLPADAEAQPRQKQPQQQQRDQGKGTTARAEQDSSDPGPAGNQVLQEEFADSSGQDQSVDADVDDGDAAAEQEDYRDDLQ